MQYQQAHDIEQRLDQVLRLIAAGEYSTSELATLIGVSVPTMSRCIRALRDRGYDVVSTKTSAGWSYTLNHGQSPTIVEKEP